MEMLENNQQGIESRTVLVEDRVNVVEDSVHHLQGDFISNQFFTKLIFCIRDSVNTFCV